jgi:hypothetical protein
MKKPVYPRGPKVLRDFMDEPSTELDILLSYVELRTVRRHANVGQPNVEIAATYEKFARIPCIAWLSRAELKKRGLTTQDVDEAFARLAKAKAMLGIPTKPTKPVAAEETPAETLYPVGTTITVQDMLPDGRKRVRAAQVETAVGDMRGLRFGQPGGVYTLETWSVAEIEAAQ